MQNYYVSTAVQNSFGTKLWFLQMWAKNSENEEILSLFKSSRSPKRLKVTISLRSCILFYFTLEDLSLKNTKLRFLFYRMRGIENLWDYKSQSLRSAICCSYSKFQKFSSYFFLTSESFLVIFFIVKINLIAKAAIRNFFFMFLFLFFFIGLILLTLKLGIFYSDKLDRIDSLDYKLSLAWSSFFEFWYSWGCWSFGDWGCW